MHALVANSVCVMFHRDKSADIRIKLSSVSREHVQIVIDENGQCVLNHLSKTNPTLLNGEEVVRNVVLRHDDKITIGERIFCFKSGLHHVRVGDLNHTSYDSYQNQLQQHLLRSA